MAISQYTTPQVPMASFSLNGGLNSTASPLNLKDNESSDLQNIDFDKFGSIKSRNGYACLNTNAGTAVACDGLYWFEHLVNNVATRKSVRVYNGTIQKMDDLDGTWDTITGGVTMASANPCDFETYESTVYITNNVNPPIKIAAGGTAVGIAVPTGLTKAKCVKAFENYLILGNVELGGVRYPARIYPSNIVDPATFSSANYYNIGIEDGQQINAMIVLGDRLCLLKERSIWNLFFTGDADFPFVPQRSNSSVGCIASDSVQKAENGIVFLSHDGFYFYDGNNSYKLSDRINKTLLGYNMTRFYQCKSLHQKDKNRILWALPGASQTTNTVILIWDYFNNSWSVYSGISASAMASFYVGGIEERIYFQDYRGFSYRADYGSIDYPLNTATAISSYYYTNWKAWGDAVNQKATPQVYLYYQSTTCILTFAYSFDFEDQDQYSQTLILSKSGSLYGTAVYGVDKYSGSGGRISRLDLTGRGRAVKFKFANNNLGETFTIDGFGAFPYAESNV
jgi:hypothetical protein